jgi:hypothetical protein
MLGSRVRPSLAESPLSSSRPAVERRRAARSAGVLANWPRLPGLTTTPLMRTLAGKAGAMMLRVAGQLAADQQFLHAVARAADLLVVAVEVAAVAAGRGR